MDKKMLNSFVKNVQQYAFHKGLLKRGDKIIVAVSGGPDSIALAYVLNKLKDKQNFQIKLVHINYHQRGVESDKDEKFVRNFAEKLGLNVEVFDYKSGELKNLEEDMRNFRYEIFEETRKKSGFDKIAVGHTKDDGIETFLMNLIRGAGIEGLVSLKNKRDEIVRPLMCFEKKEILAFLKAVKQKFRTDKSNFNEDFSRNKIRGSLIPLLEKEYNDNIKSHIVDLMEHLRDDLEVIEDISEKVYNEKVSVRKGNIVVELGVFLTMPIALQKRLFRKIVKKILGNIKNISSANFFEFEKLIKSEKSKIGEMKIKGLKISKRKNEICFEKIEKFVN